MFEKENEKLAAGKVGADVGFERVRRITGYIGIIDRWNDAKKAEEHDRLKHSGCGSVAIA